MRIVESSDVSIVGNPRDLVLGFSDPFDMYPARIPVGVDALHFVTKEVIDIDEEVEVRFDVNGVSCRCECKVVKVVDDENALIATIARLEAFSGL